MSDQPNNVLRFEPPGTGEPHNTAWTACCTCGYAVISVWHHTTLMSELECAHCGAFGLMLIWNNDNLNQFIEEEDSEGS